MRNIITGEDVDSALSSGKKEILVGSQDVITSIAREKAEKCGIRFVVTESMPSTPVGSTPSPLNGASFTPHFVKTNETVPVHPAGLGTAPTPPFDIEYWREQFPLLKTHYHVANCSHAPQSTFTRNAALEYLENWNTAGMDWDRWMEETYHAKEEFAKIINADPSDIAVGTSVSELTSVVASSLPLNTSRKKVVVTDAEFPTVGHVWQANQKYGFKVQFIPIKDGIIDISDYDRYVDEDTIITSLCDVYYYNGFKQDLKSIIPKIHEKGSLAYVDAYQGLGTHPLDVKELDIDFLASGNLKYLLSVPGIAFLYVKKEIVEHLRPAFTGWFGRVDPFAFEIHNLDWAKDARRFDNGTPPVPSAYIATAGMKIINTVGVENIYEWTNILSEHCIKGAIDRGLDVASPTDYRMKGPNTAIRVPGDSHEFELALRNKGVIASARSDVVRIAPHFFTKREDIDHILDCYVELIETSTCTASKKSVSSCWEYTNGGKAV